MSRTGIPKRAMNSGKEERRPGSSPAKRSGVRAMRRDEDGQAEERRPQGDGEHRPRGGGDALAAPEADVDRKAMAQDGKRSAGHGQDRIGEEAKGEEGRRETLGDVDQGDGKGEPPALEAKDVGRARGPASEAADVLPLAGPEEEVAGRDRADEIGAGRRTGSSPEGLLRPGRNGPRRPGRSVLLIEGDLPNRHFPELRVPDPLELGQRRRGGPPRFSPGRASGGDGTAAIRGSNPRGSSPASSRA